MLDVIERLLLLQERDRKIALLEQEVAAIAPQRQALQTKAETTHSQLEAARHRIRQLESDRKKLELEVVAKQQLIEKYSLQQFQTKKNDEYRALSHEIDNCKGEIAKLEDQELAIMEESDAAQKTAADAARVAETTQREAEKQLADLAERERVLRQQLAELIAGRNELATAVEGDMLPRYERLRRNKGDRVVVGVEHGACGGCHMKLPAQVVLACRANQEVVSCPNCGRILFYTRDMDMVVAE